MVDDLKTLINPTRLRANLPHHHDAKKLILTLQQSVTEELTAITHAFAANDVKTVSFHAHSLASASLYFGFEGIGLAARTLEEKIEQGIDQEALQKYWQRLQDACKPLQRLTPAELHVFITQFY